METASGPAGILLVDDGELDGVTRVLEQLRLSFERVRGPQIAEPLAPPRDLLIVTPRFIDRVRLGSPADAAPGRPLRVVALRDDSSTIRRQLRRSGVHLLVHLRAEAEIWRLIVARALYHGKERRLSPRVAVGAPVAVSPGSGGGARTADAPPRTQLLDLSNRGCRLRTNQPISVGDRLTLHVPPRSEEGEEGDPHAEPLVLPGRVRRLIQEGGSPVRTLAMVFDADLPDRDRTRLTAMINRWASGPASLANSTGASGPPIPPCRLPSLPDLMLDDETDPPVHAETEVSVALEESALAGDGERGSFERRRHPRGRYGSPFLAESPRGPLVMMGRDLSPSGMRVESMDSLRAGDRFRLALHGPGPTEPIVVQAEVTRDDGPRGLALVFRAVDAETITALEKLVACLPDVEALGEEDDDAPGLATILSEVLGA